MKRTYLASLALMLLVAVGCTASPNAGHQIVLVKKPLIAGHGGVDPQPIQTGLTFIAPTTDAIDVDMLPQRTDLSFEDTMTSSGVPVDFHVVITFRVTDAVKLVTKFGADGNAKGWGFFTRNLDQPIRTAVRDAVKKHDMQEMAIKVTAVDQVQKEVFAATNHIIQSMDVPVTIDALTVGRVNPPDAIKHQRIATAEQEQRLITEQQRKLAEDQRKLAEESRAAADNAYNQRMQLSPEQYVQLEHIRMLREVCKGATCTFIAGGAEPVLQVGKR